MGRGRRARRGAYANGLLARGVRKGDAFAILARNSARLGAVRLRARARSAPSALPSTPPARARDVGYLLDALRGGRRRSARTPTQLAKVEERARASCPRLQHVLTFARPRRSRRRTGRDYAATHPTALDEAAAAIDEDDLFTYHLHVGDDRAAEGLHDLAPQLLRDGDASSTDRCRRYYRPDDVMLLYLPLAHNFGRLMHLLGRVRRLHDRVPAPIRCRSRKRCRRCARRVLPSVPRVYEKVHTAVVAAFDAATGAKRRLDRLGARDRARGQPRSRAQAKPVPRGLARASIASPTGSSSARSASALGGRLRMPDLGRRAAREGDRRVLRRDRHPHPRGLRPHRVHDRAQRRTRPSATASARSGRPLPGFELRLAEDGEIADPQRDGLPGLLQGAGGDGRGARRRRLAQDRRHRRDRRGRLPHDHRPQEGHHRHRGRQERRAAEHRERPEDVEVRLTGARRRRPRGPTSRR